MSFPPRRPRTGCRATKTRATRLSRPTTEQTSASTRVWSNRCPEVSKYRRPSRTRARSTWGRRLTILRGLIATAKTCGSRGTSRNPGRAWEPRSRNWRTRGLGETGRHWLNQRWALSQPFHSQEWSMSNFPCSFTRNITSHSMENFAMHSLLRWNKIMLPILATSLNTCSL